MLSGKQVQKPVQYLLYGVSVVLWICIWHMAGVLIDNELFLPSPGRVWEVLYKELLRQEDFRISIMTSLVHIGKGFLLGCLAGIILAIFSSFSEIIRILLWFPMKLIKTIPVASFVILILLWVNASELSTVIPFLMVLPTLYIHTLTGIEQMDTKLLEMTQVFGISRFKKLWYLYLPQILPYISSATSLAIGMAWKSGIAAEIIGLAQGTIGNRLYQSKIYLNTPELFAWTIVIVILSIVCEWLLHGLMQYTSVLYHSIVQR